jgi:tetratricopeptide (TPR) repeat protein
MSKLIRYCEGVMEAVWLAAIVCVPLFLNYQSESIESEKNYLLRSLTIVLLTAWSLASLFKVGLRGGAIRAEGFSCRTLLKTPLMTPALLLGLSLVVSTVLSLSPWVSFWGGTVRRLGSYSYFCCLSFFFAMVATVRSREQVNRIIALAILTSVPVSLSAIGQRYSIDPRFWGTSTLYRSGATFAHPIYLGAYLIMIFPLTSSRIVHHFLTFRSRSTHWAPHLAQIIVYGLTACLQLWAIVVAVSRGPIVGLVTGFSVMSLMLAIYWRKRWLVLAPIGAGILLAGLAFVSWSIGPLRQIRKNSELQRLTEMLNPKLGTGGERAAVWGVAAQAFLFPKTVEMGEGRKDPFPSARFLVGYGPENVGPVSRLYTLREFNNAVPDRKFFDRFHNDFWDMLITTGTLGVAAFLALTFQLIYYACKWLGFVATQRQRATFWWFLGAGGLVGMLGLVFWQGLGFLGLGLRFGTCLGLIAFLVWVSWRKELPATPGPPSEQTVILIALLSALVGHLIEICFSFVFETTLLHFWIYSALLLLVGRQLSTPACAAPSTDTSPVDSPSVPADHSTRVPTTLGAGTASLSSDHEPAVIPSAQGRWYSWRVEILGGIALALVWTTLGIMLIQKSAAHSAIQTMVDALTRLPGHDNAFTWVVLVAVLFIWLLSAIVWTNEFGPTISASPWLRSFATTLTVSGALAFVCWYVVAQHVASPFIIPDDSLQSLNQYLEDRFFSVKFYYGSTFILILLMALFLPDRPASPAAFSSRFSYVACGFGGLLVLASIALINSTNLRWSKAGMMEFIPNEVFSDRATKKWMALNLHQEAIKTVPAAENHYLALGKILIEEAGGKTAVGEEQALYAKADLVLDAGSKLSPLEPAFLVRRANLYLKWALSEPAGEKRASLGRTAISFYQKATVLDPGSYTLWNNIAYVQIAVIRSFDEAHRSLLRALELHPDPHPVYGLLGDLFFQKGSAAADPRDKDAFLRSAATNYQQAAVLCTNATEASYRYTISMGRSYASLGELGPAIAAYQDALKFSPQTEVWRNEEILARLYSDSKNPTNALIHWQSAFDRAPENKRPDLLKLKAEILARP